MENGESAKKGELPLRLRSRTVVGLAGLLAWSLLGPLPLRLAGMTPLHPWLAWSLPALSLGLGLAAMRGKPRIARMLLLGSFPPSAILGAFLMQPDAQAGLGALATSAAALGMLLYVAGAVRVLGGAMELAPSVSARLEDDAHVPGERRRRIASALWVTLASAGAFLVLAVAPHVESPEELAARFGDSAGEARLLMASVGASLGLGALAFVVAPSLRARRSTEREGRRMLLRAALYLLALAVTTLALWRLYRS